ncbi:MAG TPA: ATP synthase F0 subunit B [Polyangia bacterium]|nr:ATP synthase F0 subunit B [Polyangia bacterium]
MKKETAKMVTRMAGLGLVAGLLLFGATEHQAKAEEHENAQEHVAEIAHAESPPGEGHGHGEGAPEVDTKKLIFQFVNFGVLVFILVKFGGGAINKALKARHEQLKADLASAAELKAAAEAKLAQQEKRLASLEAEIADMRRSLAQEAEGEKARLMAAAEERAARIKAETKFLIEQQVRDASARLRRESADAALKIAEDILKRSIGAGDQQKLLDTFVGNVEKNVEARKPLAGGPL